MGKIFLVNAFLLIVILFLTEIVMGEWFETKYISNCFTEEYHHEYCAEWEGNNTLSSQDGGDVVPIYVNKDGIRVRSESEVQSSYDVTNYDVINIGDSFMQADEVVYDEMLASVMNDRSDLKVLQVGYSSWAPIQMYNWVIAQSIKAGSTVNLFTMVNDYIPSYRSSNYGYHKIALRNADGSFYFSQYKGNKNELKLRVVGWRERSFFFSRFDRLIKTKKRVAKLEKAFLKYSALVGDSFQLLGTNCKRLAEWTSVTPLTYDYLSFSFDSTCWTKEQVAAVDNAITDIDRIYAHLKKEGVRLNVFVIPPGWSFAGENMVGKGSAAYKIAPETVITTRGLMRYVSTHTKARVIDLEPVIDGFKIKSENKMYLRWDGHWTAEMQEQLAEWMIDRNLKLQSEDMY